jgi:hypothetical protein
VSPLYPQVVVPLTEILNATDEKIMQLALRAARQEKIPKEVLHRFALEAQEGVIRACCDYWTCK